MLRLHFLRECTSSFSQKISDVPDNVELRKDSDIDLVQVLESLAPVADFADASVKPKGEGIERFRRRVEPGGGVAAPTSNGESTFLSQDKPADIMRGTPPSGDGEFDSGYGLATTWSKKSALPGEDSSGSEEASGTAPEATVTQGKPVIITPEDAAQQVPEASASGDTILSTAADTQVPSTTSNSSQSAETAPNAATNPEGGLASPVSIHASAEGARSEAVSTQADEATTVNTNQESSKDESSGSGLTADEIAFIAGLHKAQEKKESPKDSKVSAKLPGSVGDDENDENEDEESSGSSSGEYQLDSGSGELHDRSDIEIPQSGSASGEIDDASFESGSASDSEFPNGSDVSDVKRKDRIIEVASGSGFSFVSGAGQESSDEALPGSIGSESDIEPSSLSSGSGQSTTLQNSPLVSSGSGEIQTDSLTSNKSKSSEEELPTQRSELSGSGEPQKSPEEALPGGVGGIANLEQSHAQDQGTASGEGEASAYVESTQFSGSGGNTAPEEYLPGNVRGQVSTEQAMNPTSSEKSSLSLTNPNQAQLQPESPATIVTPETAEDFSGSAVLTSLPISSGSGLEIKDLDTTSTQRDSLPGSTGAVGPNLMSMASPGSFTAGPVTDKIKEDVQMSGSGDESSSMATEKPEDDVSRRTLASGQEVQDSSAEVRDEIPKETMIAGEGLNGDDLASGSGSKDSLMIASGEEERLPGGLGYQDLQLLAGSGGETVSGFSYSSGLDSGSGLASGLSLVSETGSSSSQDSIASSSGSGLESVTYSSGFSPDLGNAGSVQSGMAATFEAATKKTVTPKVPSASGITSGSGTESEITATKSIIQDQSSPLAVQPIIAESGSGSGSGSGSEDQTITSTSADASTRAALPGSFGIEESFSSSGSGLPETSAATVQEGSSSQPVESVNSSELPQVKKTTTEGLGFSDKRIEVDEGIESGAGEGSGTQTPQSAGEDLVENNAAPSNLLPSTGFSAALGSAALARVPFALGSGSMYGFGSGSGVDYGSTPSFLSGSGLTGTLELTPANNPSDAVVNLFGSGVSREDSDKEIGEDLSSKKHVQHRHQIPISTSHSKSESTEDSTEEVFKKSCWNFN